VGQKIEQCAEWGLLNSGPAWMYYSTGTIESITNQMVKGGVTVLAEW
jgi:hypothetical protein